ncbi:MAG: AsmA-like C-terminal region-containing protein, partial [Siphonobacter sp.]
FVTTHVNTDLSVIDNNLNATSYSLDSGRMILNARYRGNVRHIIDSTTGKLSGFLEGKLEVINGTCRYPARHLTFENLNVKAAFNTTDLNVTQLNTEVNGSPVFIKGKIQRLIPFLTAPNTRIYAKAEVYSPNLNLNASRGIPIRKRMARQTRQKARKQLITKIDRVLNRLETDISLTLDQFQFRHFNASAMKGQLQLTNKKLQINNLVMRAFQGNVNFTGQIDYLNDNPAHMNIFCRLRDTQIQQVFRAFDDFQQATITHQNIRGRWTSEGKIQASLKHDYTFVPGSFYGYLDFRLNDGVLLKFQPLKKIQRFIFKNRNFDEIHFAPLVSQFRFRGSEIEMDRMGIESTALTLFVGGVYSFQNKTNMFVQIPLSNLRKRRKDYALTIPQKHDGWSINLRAVDEGGDVKIKLDLGQRMRQRRQASSDSTTKSVYKTPLAINQ